jgi:hypothetical protein
MKRATIWLVEVIVKDGKIEEFFEDREEAELFEIKAGHFSSNVRRSCWTYEKLKYAVV